MGISTQISELIGVSEQDVLDSIRRLPFKQYNELGIAVNSNDVDQIKALLGFDAIMEDMGGTGNQLQAGSSINFIDGSDEKMKAATVKNPNVQGNGIELEIDGETVVKNLDDISIPDDDELDKLMQMAGVTDMNSSAINEYKGDDPAGHKAYIMRQSELMKKINNGMASQEEIDEYNSKSERNATRSAQDVASDKEINHLLSLSK